MRAFWKRKPTLAKGPPKWIVCCDFDNSNLRAAVINNPAEVPGETLHDTEKGAWEQALTIALKDRMDIELAYRKITHEVEQIETALKSLTTGDMS